MVFYSIILPIFNERQNLPITIFLLSEMSKNNSLQFQVIIVEDNSSDGSRQIAHKLAGIFKDLRIKVLQRPCKMGLGSAYRDALTECKGDFVIIMDADLSHHPKYIPLMVEKQKTTNCDIVTGSRYIKDGGVEGWSFFRKLTSRTANFVTKFTLGVQCSDFTGSFRLYRKSKLQQLMALTTTKGYSFQMQIIVRAKKSQMTVEQIPIVFVDRLYGQSKLGPNEIFIYLKGVLSLFFSY